MIGTVKMETIIIIVVPATKLDMISGQCGIGCLGLGMCC